MNRESLINLMRKHLVINQIYSRQELDTLIQENIGSSINITALTYNRWNRGMIDTLCLFEYFGRATYKFIDTEEVSKYTGKVFHVPQGESNEYLIGNFFKGEMSYLNGFKNFREWKESKEIGVKIIGIETRFEVDKDKSVFKFYISDGISKDFKNGYGPIGFNSVLGKNFIDKKEGDEIIFNDNKYLIKKII
jgi:hypothetical protein